MWGQNVVFLNQEKISALQFALMVPAVCWILEKKKLMNALAFLPRAPSEAAASRRGTTRYHLLSHEPPPVDFEETLQDEKSLSRSARLATERALEDFHHSNHLRIDCPSFLKS